MVAIIQYKRTVKLVIDKAFQTIRVNLRMYGPRITKDVFFRFHPITEIRPAEICVFCGSTANLTREHVIPKWVFSGDVNLKYISAINRQTQTYNKTVIPACSICNNSILGIIESQIKEIITKHIFLKEQGEQSASNIMRWLELLDYKTQIYDCRRLYLKYLNDDYDSQWGIFPLAMMRHFNELKPFGPFDYLRSTQRRITIKEKNSRINSFVIFRPKKPHFDFFVKPTEYIYISFSMTNIAFFYFFKKNFLDYSDAIKEALFIIRKVKET